VRYSVRGAAFGVQNGARRALLWLVCAGICSGQAGMQGAATTLQLSGKVIGASGQHTIHVALWDASGFLEKPVQEIRMEPGAATEFHFEVRPGLWALSAYEDVNQNGKLDMGMFGPREPSGFWRPFHAWRKPRFNDVAAEVDRDVTGADIRLGKQ
jgi:uncharacterized protein (DUF2141 family)